MTITMTMNLLGSEDASEASDHDNDNDNDNELI